MPSSFPYFSIAIWLFYILFAKMDSSCYRVLRHVSPAVKKNHWTCLLYSALTDFQRTVNVILQCRPYLKALRSELKLSRKINKNSGVKILVNSFAPLAWTELLKMRVSITCGAGLRLWNHKAQGAKHMSLNMCACRHAHVHILETTHTQFIHYVSVHNHNDNVQIPV